MGAFKKPSLRVVVVLAALLLCALFLAQGATNLVAASFFPLVTSVQSPPSARAGAPRADARRTRDDTDILRRNIFDHETGPLDGSATDEAVATSDGVEPPEVLDGDAPLPVCEGSVRLVGAVVNPRRPLWSFAAIIGTAGKAMLFRQGMRVDDRELLAIHEHRVIFRPSSGAPCQITMFAPPEVAAARPAAPARPARPAPPATPGGSISAADMEAGISRVSDTNFNVQRGFVDQILAHQGELMRTARIIPHEQGGRVVGVKMYGIRRNSLLGKLGLQNGDMLRTINGFDMSSPDSALEAYARLRNADHLSLQVVRRGQPTTIDYNIQ